MWTPGPIHLTRFHNEDKKNDVSWREANASRFKVARFVQGPEALASVRTWYEHMHLIYKCYVSILLTQSYTLQYTAGRLLILGIYCFDKSHLMIIQNTFGQHSMEACSMSLRWSCNVPLQQRQQLLGL